MKETTERIRVKSGSGMWPSDRLRIDEMSHFILDNMGLVTRKPVFGVFGKASLKPVFSARQTS